MSSSQRAWDPEPALPSLGDDAVHVWRVWLDQPDPVVAGLSDTLSPDERRRAHRFRFARHGRHYIVGRGVLRAVLGHYLALPPGELGFTYGPAGKPALDALNDGGELQFNLSHSNELALYAVTRQRRIGIDVEYMRPLNDLLALAEGTFSAHEYAALSALSGAQQLPAFFNCWTRKEAYVKAMGDGLSQPLDAFDVSVVPGEPARLLRIADDPAAGARWTLRTFAPAPSYVAALAVEGRGWKLVEIDPGPTLLGMGPAQSGSVAPGLHELQTG